MNYEWKMKINVNWWWYGWTIDFNEWKLILLMNFFNDSSWVNDQWNVINDEWIMYDVML